jgi:hypothetical protein
MEGMLLQEYVADMLEVRIPEGWEESVRKAYGRDPDKCPEGDDRDSHSTPGMESEGDMDEKKPHDRQDPEDSE